MKSAPPQRAVLFDLDGTLVDPRNAITSGLRSALSSHGVLAPSDHELEAMIGPPLAESLQSVSGVTAENLPSIIEAYRRQYRATGMASSAVYPGIEELVTELRRDGVLIGVATSKPEPLAVELLTVMQIHEAFDVVCGATAREDGPHEGKAAIIARALQRLGDPPLAVMVGDRHFDVEGARAHGLACVGVEWGYARAGELEAAGAAYLATDAVAARRGITELLDVAAKGECR
ncbi:HAD hydrolase-like protein [Zhihengliuella flava]|uniref:Phosphoglycolate phosphatase n=1 Tax=Zhihengliuella flava TaxID=1285193 RepID=A0A931D7G8_9MICC|nr:HAD hydrolase-like protein [Zhihengliuella flava]MBG6083487.1 phosphoglycolate phosphatase [Zhihengliuella flava]